MNQQLPTEVQEFYTDIVAPLIAAVEQDRLDHGMCCDPRCTLPYLYVDLNDTELKGAIAIVARLTGQDLLEPMFLTHLIDEQLKRTDTILGASELKSEPCQKKQDNK